MPASPNESSILFKIGLAVRESLDLKASVVSLATQKNEMLAELYSLRAEICDLKETLHTGQTVASCNTAALQQPVYDPAGMVPAVEEPAPEPDGVVDASAPSSSSSSSLPPVGGGGGGVDASSPSSSVSYVADADGDGTPDSEEYFYGTPEANYTQMELDSAPLYAKPYYNPVTVGDIVKYLGPDQVPEYSMDSGMPDDLLKQNHYYVVTYIYVNYSNGGYDYLVSNASGMTMATYLYGDERWGQHYVVNGDNYFAGNPDGWYWKPLNLSDSSAPSSSSISYYMP